MYYWKSSTTFRAILVCSLCVTLIVTTCMQTAAEQSTSNKSRISISTKDASISKGKKKSAFRMLFKPPPIKYRRVRPPAKKASKGPLKDSKGNIRLFRTIELRGKLKALPRWQRIVTKMNAHKLQYLSNSLPTSGKNQRKRWQEFKSKIASANRMEQIRKVNSYFNNWPYRLDKENWGKSEYWATPPEFVKKSGDCEDYAIAKYYALRELGLSTKRMRIVALQDNIRRLGHAVLVVYINDDAYVLDNQTKLVLPHGKFLHYVPQFSVNELNRWAHIPVKKNQPAKQPKNDSGADNAKTNRL